MLGLLGPPALWLGSAFVYETWDIHRHRFRLTIEVDDNGTIQSGSSVIEVAISGKATWVPQTGGVISAVRGEAVFVAPTTGRNLLALLGLGADGTMDIDDLAARAFGRYEPFWYRQAPSWRGRAELTSDLIPTLVTLDDINNPETAHVVAPKDFPAVFGPGVRFKSATIEMTEDKVTRKIDEYVPSIRMHKQSLYDRIHYTGVFSPQWYLFTR